MAITLTYRIKLAASGKYFDVYDTTGTYSSLNTGGYGTPNPLPSNATTATLEIWNPLTNNLPDPTQTVSSTIDMYPTLPNYAGAPFTVTNTAAGFGTTTFKDGAYYMTYTITGTYLAVPFTYTVSCYQFFYHNIRCCLDKWNAKLLSCGCGGGNNQEHERYELAELKYTAMQNEICCGHVVNAAGLLTQLQKMCPRDCGCGN